MHVCTMIVADLKKLNLNWRKGVGWHTCKLGLK